jgi:lysophospholipase L1-like esterase
MELNMLPLITSAFRCTGTLLLLSSICACSGATPESVSAERASTEAAPVDSAASLDATASDDSVAAPLPVAPLSGSSAPFSETTAPNNAAAPSASAVAAQLPQGSTVLHVGDSFAGALGPALNQEFEAHGVKGVLKAETATYIPTWASNKALPQYLDRYKPDLVLITLGANELQIPDPQARAETVRRVVARLGDRPCVWIGIPLWEGANPALMQVIADNAAPCLFLDSTALLPNMDRAKDKIHPSTAARSEWAKQVTAWLLQHQDPAASGWHWRGEHSHSEP